jgi:hypothetical protein
MSAQHTEGRLVHHPEDNIFTIDGRRVFEVQARSLDVHCDERDATARRLAACWNALQGIPTSLLESVPINLTSTEPYRALQAQRDALLAALQPFVCFNSSAETITITVRTADITAARVAIADAEGYVR